MYKISSGSYTFDVELNRNADGATINDETVTFDVSQLDENAFHFIENNKSYNIQVVKADRANKAFIIAVNGIEYEVKAKDEFDLLLDKMGLANLSASKVNNLKAPMPGLVLEVLVKEGDEIEKDTPLLILEAMKMENVLKAPSDVKVKSLGAKKGDAVEKNHVLLTFE